jgi:hypothetical protein
MERYTLSILETNYYKVDIEYLQESQLLVAAKNEDEAVKMVESNILDTTKGFKINGVSELTEDEKKWVIQNMSGTDEDGEATLPEDHSGTRTLN